MALTQLMLSTRDGLYSFSQTEYYFLHALGPPSVAQPLPAGASTGAPGRRATQLPVPGSCRGPGHTITSGRHWYWALGGRIMVMTN